MEPKKIIHSNNYLSFFVKKDSIVSGKLTEEIVGGYYAVLNEPVNQKYKKSKEAVMIYNLFVNEEGEVDQKQVDAGFDLGFGRVQFCNLILKTGDSLIRSIQRHPGQG